MRKLLNWVCYTILAAYTAAGVVLWAAAFAYQPAQDVLKYLVK